MNETDAGVAGAVADALQCGVTAQLEQWRHEVQARGHRLGWKIGFNDRAAQQRMGLARPVLGFLRRDRLLASGGVFEMSKEAVIKAEVEIAVRLGRDVPSGASEAEAEAAIAAMAPAVEVVDVTQPLDGLEALLRGNLYHAAVLIGPEQSVIPAAPREAIRARLLLDGQVLRESEPPRLPERLGQLVQVAADTLARHGERLTAGDWIICGSVIDPAVVVPGNRIEVEMSSCERIALGFAAC